jgi:hypothetical protein
MKIFAVLISLILSTSAAQAAPDIRQKINQTINGQGRIALMPILNAHRIRGNVRVESVELITRANRNDAQATLFINNQAQDRVYLGAGQRRVDLNVRNNISVRNLNNFYVQVRGYATIVAVIIHLDDRSSSYPPDPGYERSEDMTCSSYKPLSARCGISRGAQILQVRLIRQISGDACIYGRSWFYDYSGVTVTNGCRGVFRVITRN